ncbi:MAG: esterase-like activity of phytase family protein [Pyrinomonadaceae bacterium]|nr:esterase-like activity of phytase family protein [Pyrinomonadaceae bacterium]
MKSKSVLAFVVCLNLVFAPFVNAQFNGYNNQGMVGVGRIPANSFDTLGNNVDTLGGIFSAMAFDRSTLVRSEVTAGGNPVYTGTLYGLPDRGFGDGAQDYRPRIQRFDFSIAPYYSSTPTTLQNQIGFRNNGTLLLTNGFGTVFTGFDGNDATATMFPQSAPNSLGQGRRSLDPEGLVLTNNGGYWVSDEYGANIYRFDRAGSLVQTLPIPAAIVPKTGSTFPRTNFFSGATSPATGRYENRGMEGLTVTPDGNYLVAMLQSPTVQDGNNRNNGVNTRILIYDIASGSPTVNRLVGEYVYVLTRNGRGGRSTPISEIYALNNHQFLILERDDIGLGSGNNVTPGYKKVNLADVSGATNIAGTGYDLEPGAAGALSFPLGSLPANVIPAKRQDFVNLIDTAQLGKFNFNINATPDQNTIPEKQEGLELIPLREPSAPNDFLLLVGNDNDFKSSNVFHNGSIVGTNSPSVDNIIFAFRLTLPISRQTAVRKNDFDGDGRSDLAVFRNGEWFALRSSDNALFSQSFGLSTDVLTPADYDGDSKTDLATYRNGIWYVLQSSNNAFRTIQFGQTDDIPVAGDYDGDGRADIAVFRPSDGTWYSINSFGEGLRNTKFGQSGDVPAIGDYDGDSKTDLAVFRNGTWFTLQSRDGFRGAQFGQTGDIPVAGDYDGDGKTDFATYRNGTWSALQSGNGTVTTQNFGLGNDTTVVGDYDGDGRNDLAVFRRNEGIWYLQQSRDGFNATRFGLTTDVAVR